jgi:hypothetical protein
MTDGTQHREAVLPMILIGIGQSGTLSPLTISGIAGVSREDAGAASGPVNAASPLISTVDN